MDWFRNITDIAADRQALAGGAYGRITVREGRVDSIQLRPWPKLVSMAEVLWLGGWQHQRGTRDQIQLFYNQPRSHRKFLALKYIVSSVGTSLLTLRCAMQAMDEIAILKRSDAIVCEASNPRINERIMKYFGYERHLPNARRKHFIRRFYGEYPESQWGESKVA